MAKLEARERVRSLRRAGLSISDIAKKTHESKSSISYWCRDITLTLAQLQKLQERSKRVGVRQFLFLGEQKRRARIRREKKGELRGQAEVSGFLKRDLFVLGLGLYWGEGYKRSNGELGFTNSDPKMMLVFMRWLLEIYDVPVRDLIARVSVNLIHKPRIQKITQYWSRTTGIPVRQFSSPSFIKTVSRKRYSNHDSYFGILRIKVRRGGEIKSRILGSLAKVAEVYSSR